MRSSTPRSISIAPPTMSRRTCLAVSLAACRTRRYRRSDMLSNSTMRVRSRSSCRSRVRRACAASSSSVDCSVRCRPRCTVATSFTDSAIMRVSSWNRVKRSISNGSNDCAEALAASMRETICVSACSSMSRNCRRRRSKFSVRSPSADFSCATSDSMRERVMLTSPAWLTRRSSSCERTRTADWLLAAWKTGSMADRRTGCSAEAAPVDGGGLRHRHGRRLCRHRRRGDRGLPGCRLRRGRKHRHDLRHRDQRRQRRRRCLRRLDHHCRGLRLQRHRLRVIDFATTQHLEAGLDRIDATDQTFDVGGVGMAAPDQVLDGGFQSMRHLAQAHRAGQARAALERVQRAHARRRGGGLGRPAHPLTHARLQLRDQLFPFFLEDREQLGVDGIDGVDVVFVVQRVAARRGQQRGLARCRRGQFTERAQLGATELGEIGQRRDRREI